MKTPFNQYSQYLKNKYGARIQKITVHGGFSCPNRDGTVGVGGCTYCNNKTFAAPDYIADYTILEQVNHGIKVSKLRYKADQYIVYFQAYSNTYAPLAKLKVLFSEALSHPQVVGLSIGTRPDCIDFEKIKYLLELAQHHDITVEYGLESMSNETLNKINRGHTFESFESAVNLTSFGKIKICTHLIIGFPWETKAQILQTAQVINKLPIDFLKIHQLHIVKDTVMGREYEQNPFKMQSMDEYMDVLIDFLELLDPKIVIQRMYGESPKEYLLSQPWGVSMSEFLKILIDKMHSKGAYQGRLFNP
ncbi:MAG: TIGR01212 family radical SAM protein [Bacteriovoracaceae bacterium]|nr:TIGR01212 family radical SAM protein [Bacteriovoracaceae bacterium]